MKTSKRYSSAFTLIELLVVVSIIVILIAMLVPALEKAIEQANRAVCAANMDAQGLGYVQYAIDNKSILPSSVRIFGGMYPFTYWINPRGNEDVYTRLFVEYIGGIRSDGLFEGDIWYCPSTGHNNDAHNQALAQDAGNERQESHYGFIARVDLWEYAASRPGDHTEKFPGGSRLLASEVLFKWWINGGWFYTHGGSPHHYLGPVHIGTPRTAGINQLWGDGAVIWKSADEFDLVRINTGNPDRDLKWIQGGGGGTKDTTYY